MTSAPSTFDSPRARSFLESTRASSQATYEAFKSLLEDLESPHRRKDAARLVQEVAALALRLADPTLHFRFRRLDLGREVRPLLLLELPSVFAPEQWSFTFYEGLLRLPASDWQGRSVAELGCGNGWITLAL